ncbi:MAG TPA: bifunctional diaminohydroxyphosphoribosylaminopyrimidine deaminase/5-amino-6-(5-phosphoribosylamino)uracil reductase RibD [Chromatiales bacterium]|nr:bifunctional diaminohydroxyphosphoribosylaminopyrimidine deaminase/5-amino-6-(5-phosphoribosylamino)uracil reductase RibD [Chromatiales bacterium]
MARALQLARRGLYTAHPNPRVGCVIVRDGRIVGEGWHERTGGPHAEIVALAQAGADASGATVYVTLEPCCHQGRTPPCTDALIAAGVARVVAGAPDPNPAVAGGGLKALQEAGIDTVSGVLEAQCSALNAGFNLRMRCGRPRVTVKIAASVDGRTALSNGVSQWISGTAAREDVQRLRARSGAIMTGIGTVLADDPMLTVRGPDFTDMPQPLRVILDSQLRLPPDARLLNHPGEVRVFTVADVTTDQAEALRVAGAKLEPVQATQGRPALEAVLERLAGLEVNDVLVEAGPGLNGALLDAGLVDELIVYQAAHLLGADAQGMFASRPLATMDQRTALTLTDLRRVGRDIRLSYTVQPQGE